jgi:plasmid stability protein
MATTITLPDTLVVRLEQQAHAQHRSVEEIALDLLHDALSETEPPSVADVVATIKATPPNPSNVRTAQGSLADALRRTTSVENFDLDRWNADWAAVEAELRATTRFDDLAEGRG